MGVCTCVVEMVRLDAIGNQVGLLVVIMMGGPIRVKAKYSESISRARGFFESSINSGDTDNGNKQKNIFLLPSAQY